LVVVDMLGVGNQKTKKICGEYGVYIGGFRQDGGENLTVAPTCNIFSRNALLRLFFMIAIEDGSGSNKISLLAA
jgi:hypothetical protein